MKTLYLLRHAKSSWEDQSLEDFDRPLAPRGSDAAPRIAKRMKKEGWIPDVVLCSAARRAVDTLALVRSVLGLDGAALHIDQDLYMAEPSHLLERVRGLPDTTAGVLLVGHNPAHEDLAHSLIGDGNRKALKRIRKKYPTGALAVIHFRAERWAQVGEGAGYLEAFVRPKDV
jgi:phosphohistidine phosphatase